MLVQTSQTDKIVTIEVHEYTSDEYKQLAALISSYNTMYPFYDYPHENGISRILIMFSGFLTNVSPDVEFSQTNWEIDLINRNT